MVRSPWALTEGTVFGEMSLLTGEVRSCTVRSIDGALIYEIDAPYFGGAS